MEDINLKNNSNDMKETHILNKINYYHCSECESLIEIMILDEEYIEFKCNNNNHNIKIKIKEYLNKIKENKHNIILNNSICNKHKEEYFSYCFDIVSWST